MKRVGIFFTKQGEESDVSLETYQTFVSALKKLSQYNPISIEIRDKKFFMREEDQTQEIAPTSLDTHIDCALIATHGSFGEDGQLQKILEEQHIPFVGTRGYQSSVAFSKATTKDVLERSLIQSAPYVTIHGKDVDHATASHIFSSIPQPCIIKPSNSGSSHGVSKCSSVDEIREGIVEALKYSDVLIAEEFIDGQEFAVGVIRDIRDQELYILPPVEIIPPVGKDFFDTESKYDGSTQEICPAQISDELRIELEKVTKNVVSTIVIEDYARVDFRVHPKRGIFVLEVNTLPGMSSESLFPKELTAVGITMSEFLEHVLTRALTRG